MRLSAHYLSIALRQLARNRAYAVINIGGLALGLAGCLLILSYVRYESSYDRWLPGNERVYQVQTTQRDPAQPVIRSQSSPFPVRDTLPGGFPQIEALTVLGAGPTVVSRDGQPTFLDSATVDPTFFDIFRLPFVAGSPVTALADTRTVVLTEREAISQFGTSDVLGRTLSIGAGPGKQDYRIGGVLRDLPKNSSLRFGILFRNDASAADQLPPNMKGWGGMSWQHYVKLRPGADAAAINAALPAWEKRTIPPETIDGKRVSPADTLDLRLVPIADVHLGLAQQGALAPGGDPRTLATFSVIALLTLAMAVMNFINLTTARATQRAREVALRKVLGATRRQVAVQMLGESFLMAAAAMLLALTIAELATPWVAAWTDTTLTAHYFGEGGMAGPALALLVATGGIGGLYPALYLSRFRPAEVLRANRAGVETPGSGRFRAGLVLFQFAIAIGLIACTWVIWSQNRFIQANDPGYRRDGLIQISAAWRFAGDEGEYRAAHRAMLRIPGVVATGRTDIGIATTNRSTVSVRAPGATDLSFGRYVVDADLFAAMGMRVLAGRTFDERFGADRVARTAEGRRTAPASGVTIVVNRTAAAALGDTDPARAIGRPIRVAIDGAMTPATIVGVVEDTRLRGPREAVEPIFFLDDTAGMDTAIVRYAGARPADVMAGLTRVWRQFEPEIPFEGEFAETILAETYAADLARGALFAGFAALAVMIACLGLYSLAAFATERRTREIGIRKVLGAKVRHIVQLLAWQFSKPVVLANLVAWPVAWWAMRDWLNTFDARIALGPTPFALAGLLALGIALATVAGHALRVARLNPIHALRYE